MPHTPGPWHSFYAGSGLYQIFDLAGEEVASLSRGQDKNEDETYDNTCLIAQAPAMYELLKEIEFTTSMFNSNPICPWCDFGEEAGHEEGCKLAAVLKAVEGNVQ